MAEINPVLVVVDVQNGFVTEHSKHVVPIIEQLVRGWLQCGRDVIFTRYINYDESPFEKFMGWSALKESPEIDIVDELQDLCSSAVAVVDKRVYTLFNQEGTKLAEAGNWTDLVACGIDTEVCVLKTAVDAFERSIRSWIVEDASASHSGVDSHSCGITVARKMIGRDKIISVKDALAKKRFP